MCNCLENRLKKLQIGKERNLGYDPLRVAYYPGGDYVMVTGSAKTCELYSNQGVRLGVIGEPYKSWVWCVAARPHSSNIVRLDFFCSMVLFEQVSRQLGVKMGLLLTCS